MKKVILLQLPIQKLNYGMKSGNIPMGAASLKTAYDLKGNNRVEILDEFISSNFADGVLIERLLDEKPDYVGFTVYNWNLERSKYIAERIKRKTGATIIFGGPEITEDNLKAKSNCVDYYIFGEGENRFFEIIEGKKSEISLFENSIDPYFAGLIDFKISGTMLLETMRGCPYRCGYCYYNKSRSQLSFRDEKKILDSINWAVENGVEELYLLDPSLNIRPDLKELLRKIHKINKDKQVRINSEIRADKIDKEDADLFEKSGFNGFETGLQTTNSIALEIMNRKTNLKDFVKGVNLLKEREITPRIDLILGLPGDDLKGFQESILFINDNNMFDDVQVFPLSVLPGTDFRKNSKHLGLNFEEDPPYTVINTSTFSRDEMLLAIDNTENLFDMALFPLPDLDISLNIRSVFEDDVYVSICNVKLINKVVINRIRKIDEIREISFRLTNPYQIIFSESIKNIDYILDVVKVLSENNPFTPFEIVFFEPEFKVDTDLLLHSVKLKRPQFLDNDLRLQYNKSGNRSVLFTVVSDSRDVWFYGEMKRQVFWWKKDYLPELIDLEDLKEFDALYLDCKDSDIDKWIDDHKDYLEENFFISFSSHNDQLKFLKKTTDDYIYNILPTD